MKGNLVLITTTAVVISTFFLVFTSAVQAAASTSGGITAVACPADQTYIGLLDECLDFESTVSRALGLTMIIGTMLGLIRLLMGALQMVVSTNEPDKLENARDIVRDALLGLVLIATAWVLFATLSDSLPSEWQINLLGFD